VNAEPAPHTATGPSRHVVISALGLMQILAWGFSSPYQEAHCHRHRRVVGFSGAVKVAG
jgi:hypothetical protein